MRDWSRCGSVVLVGGFIASGAGAQTTVPWAVEVVSFDAGTTGTPGFDDPSTALGEPERFTGELAGFPSVVSPFNPAFGTDEIVSIGEGGHLTLRFDRAIRDDPGHLFGVDLIIFGNGGFVDSSFPDGVVGSDAAMFGLDEARLELSVDGVNWVDAGMFTEGFAPAMGYLDAGPFDTEPGTVPTDFTRPVDPALTAMDFAGLDMDGIRALYAGSGGGTSIDVAGLTGADTGFQFVRISVDDDQDPNTFLSAEIDGIAVVPAPASLLVLMGGLFATRRRR